MGTVEQPEHIELDHPSPLLHRGIDDGAQQHHSGVVDQSVEAAVFGHRALDHGTYLTLVGDVGLEYQHPAVVADPLRQCLEPITSPGGDRYCRTLGDKCHRGGLTDTAGCPRHQGHRSLQPRCHRTLSVVVKVGSISVPSPTSTD